MTISRILLGADETPAAAAAADWAAHLARAHRAELDAVESLQVEGAEMPPDVAEEQERALRGRVQHWMEAHGDITERMVVASVAGDPAHVLPAYATDHGADVVVVGAGHAEGVSKLGLGSLAHSLAHRLHCPVVAVPAGWSPGPLSGIVVGVDGGDGGIAALRWAEELAGPLEAVVTAVYVATGSSETPVDHGPLEQAVRAGTLESAQLVERAGVDPAVVLAEEAASQGAGLIVVAAKTRGAMGGVRLGSVPDKLLHELPRPVAVLPYPMVHPDELTEA